MTVTVVVSGLPNYVNLSDLAYHLDRILYTNEVGSFRLREILESDTRILALDFLSGFDAMHVQMKLDGIELTLDNGKEYKIKSRISNDKKHTFRESHYYEDTLAMSTSKYDLASSSVISINDHMKKERSSLDNYLTFLQKKKEVVKAERELLKAKRQLKREHAMEESDFKHEDSRHKYLKMSKSDPIRSDYRSTGSTSREPSSKTSKALVPVFRDSIEMTRSRSLSRRSQSLSRNSSRSPCKTGPRYERSPSTIRKSPYTPRSSYNRKEYSSRESNKRKSPSYYRYSTNNRYSTSACTTKNYKDDEYLKRNTVKYANNKNKNSNNVDSIIEHAVQHILSDIDDLLQNEKKSLLEKEISMVVNVFKDHLTSNFRKLSRKFYRNMPIKKAIDVYRYYHSKDEDKEFILKMTQELKACNVKNAIKTSNANKTVDPKKENDVWDVIEEVLDDISLEMLQCDDDIISNSTDQCSEINHSETDVAYKNIESKPSNRENCMNVEKSNGSEDVVHNIKGNDQILGLSEEIIDNNNLDNSNYRQLLEPKQGVIAERSYVLPVKKLMKSMKSLLLKFGSDANCKDLIDMVQRNLRKRISDILKEKELLKTAQIIQLYRSVYPQQDDEMFLKDIYDNIKNEENHQDEKEGTQ